MLINQHYLHVEQYGPENGQNLIWLHHGLGCTLSWIKQADYFAEKGFRVILYDRWGYGRSDSRDKFSMPYFSEDIEDLKELIRLLKIDHAGLIGHSDGGTIALLFASKFPHLVECLVIVAAHVYIESRMVSGITQVYNSFAYDPEFQKGLQRAHPGKSKDVFNLWYQGWTEEKNQNWDITSTLRQISCPTFIIQGEEDEHASSKHAHDITEQINGSNLWIPKNEGHMFPQNVPEEFNQGVAEFLLGVVYPV